MFKRPITASLLMLAALTSFRPVAAQTGVPTYYVTDLGVLPNTDTSSPTGINDNGWVVGYTPTSRSNPLNRSWVWVPSASNPTQGTLSELKPAHALPDPLAFDMCHPGDINNGGLIVGGSWSRDATKVGCATYWIPPAAPVDFNTLLPAPGEWTLTGASGVSEPGPVGELYVSGTGRHVSAPTTDVGIVWCVSGGIITSVTPLDNAPGLTSPRATPVDMNSLGQMTGRSYSTTTSGTNHAFRWETNGQGQDLGSLPTGYTGSIQPTGINDAGVVSGFDLTLKLGWVWRPATGMTALPTLGGTPSWATGINNLDQIVGFSNTAKGWHACLWQGGTAYDLNNLKAAGATKLVLHWAREINNRGSIAATYETAQGTRSVLLTPR